MNESVRFFSEVLTLAIRLLEAKPSLKSVNNINEIIEKSYKILSNFN